MKKGCHRFWHRFILPRIRITLSCTHSLWVKINGRSGLMQKIWGCVRGTFKWNWKFWHTALHNWSSHEEMYKISSHCNGSLINEALWAKHHFYLHIFLHDFFFQINFGQWIRHYRRIFFSHKIRPLSEITDSTKSLNCNGSLISEALWAKHHFYLHIFLHEFFFKLILDSESDIFKQKVLFISVPGPN